jgi:hypothetical protein
MKTRGRARRQLCGREVSRHTFDELELGDQLRRASNLLTMGYHVSDVAARGLELCSAAVLAGDWGLACSAGATAADELWRTRTTIAGGGR